MRLPGSCVGHTWLPQGPPLVTAHSASAEEGAYSLSDGEAVRVGKPWAFSDSWAHRAVLEGLTLGGRGEKLVLGGCLRSKGKLKAELTLKITFALCPSESGRSPFMRRVRHGVCFPRCLRLDTGSLAVCPGAKHFIALSLSFLRSQVG